MREVDNAFKNAISLTPPSCLSRKILHAINLSGYAISGWDDPGSLAEIRRHESRFKPITAIAKDAS
jgi:hypothetical protein